jgi:hypothetical protein
VPFPGNFSVAHQNDRVRHAHTITASSRINCPA